MNDKCAASFNKICGRLCVEAEGYLASPLSIGSGEQEDTDADVILDASGMPFIPGSALAGVLRSYSKELGLGEKADQLFGTPEGETPGTGRDRQSRIFCYDTSLKNAVMSIRDGVKLGEHKTPEQESKYEMQIIEQGAAFRMRIEIIERKDCVDRWKSIEQVWEIEQSWIRQWLLGFSAGELRMGAKTSRGFGKLKIESARVKKFNMELREDYLKWLDWSWEDKDAFKKAECIDIRSDTENVNPRTEHVLEVPLQIPYTLMVRTYSEVFQKGEGIPDYGQLTVGGRGEAAVIPGNSFAGAFRSHIAKIVKRLAHLQSWEEAQRKLEPFFGTWTDGKKGREDLCSSKVIFEEVVVNGGHGLHTVRNAIDRFTGGTVEGALFEGRPWAGGSALLRIRWKKDCGNQSDEICGMLLWAIADLQSGILPIGGETAVGRGIFCKPNEQEAKIRLDGDVLVEKKIKDYLQKAALWCKRGKDERVGNGDS